MHSIIPLCLTFVHLLLLESSMVKYIYVEMTDSDSYIIH